MDDEWKPFWSVKVLEKLWEIVERGDEIQLAHVNVVEWTYCFDPVGQAERMIPEILQAEDVALVEVWQDLVAARAARSGDGGLLNM